MPLDVYKIVTDRFISALKSNIIPWQKPWRGDSAFPYNHATKRDYTGVNSMLLYITAVQEGFTRNGWLTYKQATALGGQVRRGSKSTEVIFWKIGKYLPKGKKAGEEEKSFLLRYYNVFNVDQIDGLNLEDVRSTHEIAAPEAVVKGWSGKPRIRHGGNSAHYSPELDYVQMPHKANFKTDSHYYHTLFHELVHSTGHKTRLDRELSGNMQSESYSREELTAEIGASFLSAHCNIDTEEVQVNAAAYVRSWVRKLEEDPRLIMTASSIAQRATNMILNVEVAKAAEEEGE